MSVFNLRENLVNWIMELSNQSNIHPILILTPLSYLIFFFFVRKDFKNWHNLDRNEKHWVRLTIMMCISLTLISIGILISWML